MPKNTSKTKNLDSVIEKYWTISIKLKIGISQLIAKFLPKQQSLNQIRDCLAGDKQIWHQYFLIKKKLKHFNNFWFYDWILLQRWAQTIKVK